MKCRDRVFSEKEKDSFIALPGKGDHSRLMPSRLGTPWQRFWRWFYSLGSGIKITAVNKDQGRGRLALFFKAGV